MQIPSRFSIAIHICLCLEFFNEDSVMNINANKAHCKKMTSEALADSVGVNSVIIRNILSQLKTAGLVSVARGSGGSVLSKNPQDISLLDIFNAVQSMSGKGIDGKNKLFKFHANASGLCPLGKNIHLILDSSFEEAQIALESYLAKVKLSDLLEKLQNLPL
ncbi:transcriptional regulator [Helicobacter muridarum]|uniref:Transcriptional regulator n=1 Tax=Helicobacter muridarum TaxID=216 RepID=A0A099TY00_9HELI|nr:Rrf2 family transcriptional regulator [Helicobacter muridarum]TLD99914.1 transcriptional regulator [Helicobacter muridarum]STQ86825.1 Putative HTH-type transcriptional regulator ywnA [Helicobacter muridarum]